MQLHHITAGGSTDHACAYILFGFVERTYVARILVVVDDLCAVRHGLLLTSRWNRSQNLN
ncbi:hypothetical protein CCP3SC15_920020 [Gammaproteobacteria bacterium]